MNKYVFLIVMFLVLGMPVAQASHIPEAVCTNEASLAYYLASERDRGVSGAEMVGRVVIDPELTEKQKAVMLDKIRIVYTNPGISPELFGMIVFKTCTEE